VTVTGEIRVHNPKVLRCLPHIASRTIDITDSGSRKTVRLLNSEWINARHDGRVTLKHSHTFPAVTVLAKIESCYFEQRFFKTMK
jgi:hypothetical protein